MVGAGASEPGKGWFKTHPSADERLERVKPVGGLDGRRRQGPGRADTAIPEERQRRLDHSRMSRSSESKLGGRLRRGLVIGLLAAALGFAVYESKLARPLGMEILGPQAQPSRSAVPRQPGHRDSARRPAEPRRLRDAAGPVLAVAAAALFRGPGLSSRGRAPGPSFSTSCSPRARARGSRTMRISRGPWCGRGTSFCRFR